MRLMALKKNHVSIFWKQQKKGKLKIRNKRALTGFVCITFHVSSIRGFAGWRLNDAKTIFAHRLHPIHKIPTITPKVLTGLCHHGKPLNIKFIFPHAISIKYKYTGAKMRLLSRDKGNKLIFYCIDIVGGECIS